MPSVVIPWGSPPINFPPYLNGAPFPYLASDPGKAQSLQKAFAKAYWESQPAPVHNLINLAPQARPEATALLVSQGYVINGQLVGITQTTPGAFVAAPVLDPFLTLATMVYYGYGTWHPGLGTAVSSTPGRPECPYAAPGVSYPGKLPFTEMPIPYGAIVGIQDQLALILGQIGVTKIPA